jgi:hypothetical protein
MTLPIAMDAIKAIANHNGCNQCHHREAPKRSRDEPLKCNKEGHGDQPQSHKAASTTNTTRALWGHCEYHNDTHPATANITARVSVAATCAQQMQTTSFCQPAQEPRVVRLTQQRQLSSPSAWPTQAAQALQQWRSQRTSMTKRRVPARKE